MTSAAVRGDTGQPFTQDLLVVPRPAPSEADRVTVRGGHFWLHGKRWIALGVNFWPRSVIGREQEEYERAWLSPALYDPSIVEEDLESVRRLGMNCVSIQYTGVDQALPLRDFLRHCWSKGFRANIYLAGAHPLEFDPARVRALIGAADLAHNPAVLAYDLAWEPVWGQEPERRRFDPAWRQWVTRRYGNQERAEAAWGVRGNRTSGGELAGPGDTQVTTDGPWKRMVADYRRLQDDLLDERYAAVRALIRALDPHTLLSARSGWGGGPFVNSPAMPFDHASGVRQLDFISPEGWGLQGGWPDVERGAFIAAYDRLVSGGKPVFWAEFGYNCGYPLAGITGAGTPAGARAELAHQRQHYDYVLRMLSRGDSDGAMAWWLPGGYRVDERSDFGILNPDRLPRPAASALSAYARASAAPPNTWLTIDRFADARGPFALWEKEAREFVRLEEQGKRIALRAAGESGR
jgi:hypothetical protein